MNDWVAGDHRDGDEQSGGDDERVRGRVGFKNVRVHSWTERQKSENSSWRVN